MNVVVAVLLDEFLMAVKRDEHANMEMKVRTAWKRGERPALEVTKEGGRVGGRGRAGGRVRSSGRWREKYSEIGIVKHTQRMDTSIHSANL